MANANSTGAPAPDQHPFINADDPEGTAHMIDCVLAFTREHVLARALAIEEYDDHPPNTQSMCGMIYVLDGARSAVEYLSHLDAVPFDNVTKLEVGNE